MYVPNIAGDSMRFEITKIPICALGCMRTTLQDWYVEVKGDRVYLCRWTKEWTIPDNYQPVNTRVSIGL